MIFDPLYFLFLAPAIILSLVAQFRVKSTYGKYAQISNAYGKTGAEVAREILRTRGISGVAIEQVDGMLSDHYDPKGRVLRLSSEVYHGNSISSAGIAAHEVGHAIQHAEGYSPMFLRQTIAPAAIVASTLSSILIMLGFVIHSLGMLKLGIVAFSVIVAFQVITLPVEFDASNRAKRLLLEYGLISPSDSRGVAAVLNAAALTYVAAALSSILTLVYYLIRAGLLGGSNKDD